MCQWLQLSYCLYEWKALIYMTYCKTSPATVAYFLSLTMIQSLIYITLLWYSGLFTQPHHGTVAYLSSLTVVQWLIYPASLWYSGLFTQPHYGTVAYLPSLTMVQWLIYPASLWYSGFSVVIQ